MKKLWTLFLALPIVLTSCGNASNLGALEKRTSEIEVNSENPYYRVIGSIDYNATYFEVDSVFDKQPEANKFVPYSRYFTGFYNEQAQTLFDESNLQDENIVIYMMASRSYWLRAPMKIDKTNFHVTTKSGKDNSTCALANLNKLICTWMGTINNPSSKAPFYQVNPDGSFVIGGDAIHTQFKIDNFPLYPDPVKNPSDFSEWEEDDPLPAYFSLAEGRVNIRFEYDKNGWLKREYAATVGYDFKSPSAGQFALESRYYYQGATESW